MARSHAAVLGAVSLILSLLLSPAQAAPATPLQQPNWSELTPAQQQILTPLTKDWDGLESFRRKKWLGIAQRYPGMKPEQQQRVSTQMKAWAALTPQERNSARAKFKQQKKELPEQRAAHRQKWEQYQALPEPEKKKFREAAAKKRVRARSEARAAARSGNPSKPIIPALSGSAATK